MSLARLTYRDLDVLSYLREQGVATAEQLTQRFFPNSNAFYLRMSTLKRNGHVEGVKLRDYLDTVPSKFRNFSAELGKSPDHRFTMAVYRLGRIYKKKNDHATEINTPIFWQHQIYLNDIRSFLEKKLTGDGFFVTDPEIRREWARYGGGADEPIPDLVWRSGGREFAFEFERTNKGDTRYFARLVNLNKSRYAKVVYFAASDSIYSTIVGAAAAFPKIAVAHSSDPGKVFNRLIGVTTISKFLGV